MAVDEVSQHQAYEKQVLEHIRRMLEDDRLRIDTTQGSRSVTAFRPHIEEGDNLAELRQLLVEAGTPDRELERTYPQGRSLDVQLQRRKWFFFAETTGRLHVKVMSPVRALARGEAVRPMTVPEVQAALKEANAGMGGGRGGIPTTVVLASTSGFTPEARDLADRRMERTVILLEPNGAGGWRVHGPNETRSLVELFDPEADAQKRQRVREYIRSREIDLGGSGIAADKIAGATMLPAQVVESELKSLAKETPGLAARRLDGRLVLFRQGATLEQPGSQEPAMIDRIKSLFGRGGETEKKIAFLSERRAALGQQRDRLYEELSAFELKESQLREEFKGATGALGKKRITSQMLQVRKDAERRQQLLTVLNQQISVVGVHLHNLELTRTGASQGLPSSDEIAEDAAKAEQVLAELQANTELAEGVGGGLSTGLSDEEAALMAELEAEMGTSPAKVAGTGPSMQPAGRASQPANPMRISPPEIPASNRPQRSEPEPG